MPEQKQPWKILRVGGREFRIFREYDDLVEREIGIYPDFDAQPEYTGEGRPFSTADRDVCPHGKARIPGAEPPGDCGGCAWFLREETPLDIIGVCMCDARRTTVRRII